VTRLPLSLAQVYSRAHNANDAKADGSGQEQLTDDGFNYR
jgi:hypothetical protein